MGYAGSEWLQMVVYGGDIVMVVNNDRWFTERMSNLKKEAAFVRDNQSAIFQHCPTIINYHKPLHTHDPESASTDHL